MTYCTQIWHWYYYVHLQLGQFLQCLEERWAQGMMAPGGRALDACGYLWTCYGHHLNCAHWGMDGRNTLNCQQNKNRRCSQYWRMFHDLKEGKHQLYYVLRNRLQECEMALWIRSLQTSLNTIPRTYGGRREPIPPGCSLTSTDRLWHRHTYTDIYRDTHTKIQHKFVSKFKKS